MVAARIVHPGSEWAVFGALQLANFTTPLLLDDDRQLEQVLRVIAGHRRRAGHRHAGLAGGQRRLRARSRRVPHGAAGSPAELQGKTATTDGPVRFTAPSLVFERGDDAPGRRRLSAGRGLRRADREPRSDADPALRALRRRAPLLEHFSHGLTTQEVASLLAEGNDPPDRVQAERALIELAAEGGAVRVPLGDDALWLRPRRRGSRGCGLAAAS